MHWVFEVFKELNVDFFFFFLRIDYILHQNTLPFFVLCFLVLYFDEIVFEDAKDLVEFCHISLVYCLKDVGENSFD